MELLKEIELIKKVYEEEGKPNNEVQAFALSCLIEYKKQLTLTDVGSTFVCPNGCGKNGDMGSCIECVGK